MPSNLNILHSFLPKFATMLAAIPGKPEDQGSGTQLVKTFADLIATKLGSTLPQARFDSEWSVHGLGP